jgi:hypothetical protein
VQQQLAVTSPDAEGGEKEVDYSNIWTPKKFQDAEYWFLKTGKFDILCSICLVPIRITNLHTEILKQDLLSTNQEF